MKKFDLESLPLCGAKTRSGTPCKRKGNKRNGRCKLHGGRSTGAKTEAGKMASRINARHQFPGWVFGSFEKSDEALLARALSCAKQLQKLVSDRSVSHKKPELIHQLVEPNLIPLEAMKFVVLQIYGVELFITIQAALDYYYQDKNAEHVKFLVYMKAWAIPDFSRTYTQAQAQYMSEWFNNYNFMEKEIKRVCRRGMKKEPNT